VRDSSGNPFGIVLSAAKWQAQKIETDSPTALELAKDVGTPKGKNFDY
jgi:hypothetical protein